MARRHIQCIDCKYATEDELASIPGWTAYECGNCNSEYHKALLNVDANGRRNKQISWSGCKEGVAIEGKGVSKTSIQNRNSNQQQTGTA